MLANHVSRGALERETEDDSDGAGGREQTFNLKIEDIGDNGKRSAEVDEAGEEVLKQLARLALDDHEGAQQLYQKPRCPKPPRDL